MMAYPQTTARRHEDSCDFNSGVSRQGRSAQWVAKSLVMRRLARPANMQKHALGSSNLSRAVCLARHKPAQTALSSQYSEILQPTPHPSPESHTP